MGSMMPYDMMLFKKRGWLEMKVSITRGGGGIVFGFLKY